LKQWESSHQLSAPQGSDHFNDNAAMVTKKKTQLKEHVCEDCIDDDKITLKSLIVLQTQHMKEFGLMMKDALLALQKNYDQLALVADNRGKRPRAHVM
jgi:ethanolamine utilization protein EutQ (cupin superfamily)